MSEAVVASSRQRNPAIHVIKYALFSASIVPSFVGAALAWHAFSNEFNLFHAVLAGLGLFLGQAAGDYFYYYGTHFHSNASDAHTKIFAGWKPLFTDSFLGDRGTFWAGVFCLGLDLIIALYFAIVLGPGVLVLAGFGALVAIFFTPLMLKGYKEPVIFLTFGPLVMTSVFYVLTGVFSWLPALASLPLGFLITAVAYLKGARYEVVERDGQTLVLKLSKKAIFALTALAYASLVLLLFAGILPTWGGLALLAVPLSYSVLQVIDQSKSEINAYLWAVARAILALLWVGAAMTLAYIYNG
jgi:1,4-dihydroxy-2-naphthoate octaprenyltransferase